MEILRVENLTKVYGKGENEVRALDGVSFSVEKGAFVAVIGPSGSGKSTLLHILGGVDRPTGGKVFMDGKDVYAQNEEQLAIFRRRQVGLIYQFYNLIPVLNVTENITLPVLMDGQKVNQNRLAELMTTLKLTGRENHQPNQLSGGQQQRVAIARVLANEPEVILCDEATSALDPNTTRQILELIRDINKKLGITVVIITHQMSVVEEICNKVAILDNGEVAEEGEVSTVFAHPKSEAARRLVMPDNTKDFLPGLTGDHVLRVVFNGALAAGSPLITQMAIDKGIAANILYASTRCIGDKVYGNMLLGLPSDEGVVKEATAYLSRKENVLVQEVTKDVQ